MDLSPLIEQCWADHDQDPEGVARRLEEHAGAVADAATAARFAALAGHVVGGELDDWPRAAGLIGRVAAACRDEPELLPVLVHLTVAATLAGDAAVAEAAASRAGGLQPEQSEATRLRIDFLHAEALARASRWPEATELFRRSLDAVAALPAGSSADRSIAVACNNFASALLELTERGPEEDRLLAAGARTALTFWRRAGTWVHEERALYLLALVHNAQRRPDEATACATQALDLIARNGDEPVDRAFLLLARAVGQRALGRETERQSDLAAARGLAAGWAEPGLREWFAAEQRKAGEEPSPRTSSPD